jgi:hypothetical protein
MLRYDIQVSVERLKPELRTLIFSFFIKYYLFIKNKYVKVRYSGFSLSAET